MSLRLIPLDYVSEYNETKHELAARFGAHRAKMLHAWEAYLAHLTPAERADEVAATASVLMQMIKTLGTEGSDV